MTTTSPGHGAPSFLSRLRWLLAPILLAVMTLEAAASGVCSAANIQAVLDTGQRATKIDKRLFYQSLRRSFPVYDDPGAHYQGTDAILDYWNAHPELKDARWLAYLLATAYHETAFRMFPVRETLANSDQQAVERLASSRCCRDKTYWKKHPESGEHYFGRGYVQLTWDYNYRRADQRFGITERSDSFFWNPGFALDPDKSIEITYDGMIHGWYTGKCLLQYFQPNRRPDWRNARRIINGLDRANDIGAHAVTFLDSIKAAEIPASFEETRAAQQSGALGTEIDGLRAQDAALAKEIADSDAALAQQIATLRAALAAERERFETLAAANERLADEIAVMYAAADAAAAPPAPTAPGLTQAERDRLTRIERSFDAAAEDRRLTQAALDSLQRQVNLLSAALASTPNPPAVAPAAPPEPAPAAEPASDSLGEWWDFVFGGGE